MELVDGDTLSGLKVRQPGGCFQPDQILPWIEQLCAVLDYAHREARIVHRDLKPRNVMMTRAGKLKVADFGIAATLSDSVSRHSMEGTISDTLSYMSPQQAEGKRPTHLDDIHALGATIYELLTGKPPFFRGNPTAIHAQILTAVPPGMTERRTELEITGRGAIPTAWEKTIAACLAKDPPDRPQSAGEVLARLSGAAGSAAMSAGSMRWVWMGTGAVVATVVGLAAMVATREKLAPVVTESPSPVAITPVPATPPPTTPVPATPLPATPSPTPPPSTPVAAPMPATPPVAVATIRPQTKPSTPMPFDGNYVIVPSATPSIKYPAPPPGVPIYRPELSDEEFRLIYPRNPRATAPGPWDRMATSQRAAQTLPAGYPSPMSTPTPNLPPAPPSSASQSSRLSGYVSDLDRWLTALDVEPSMRPQAELQALKDKLKIEAAKAPKDDPRPAAALALGEALAGAVDAREAVLMRALQTQSGPGTRLGGGNNRAFFMGVIRAEWEKSRAAWRNKIVQAAAKLQQAGKTVPVSSR